MSRKILFRGKKIDTKEWVYGYYSEFHNRPIVDEPNSCQIFEPKENASKLFNSMIGGIWHIVDAETVGQYIGLTDKNGKKVFEGDIVKATICINDWSRDGVRNEEGIYEIKYHTKHCYFYLAKERNNLLFDGNWSYFLKEIKVIGNIHDNPERLGENKWLNT